MDFRTAVAELDALVRTLEREGDERALLALELVDAIHRPALELIAAGDLEHPIARAVLEMYELAPPAGPDALAPLPLPLDLALARRPVLVEVGAAADLAPGELRAVDAAGTSVLVVNVDGDVVGFRNACALDGRSPLEGGRLAGTVLVCPWHNCAYDARSGRRVDVEDAPGLAVVPVAVRGGALEVAVDAA